MFKTLKSCYYITIRQMGNQPALLNINSYFEHILSYILFAKSRVQQSLLCRNIILGFLLFFTKELGVGVLLLDIPLVPSGCKVCLCLQ